MISKELLEKILGVEILKFSQDNFYVYYDFFNNGVTHTSWKINIHELAHKCKSWVYEQGYLIGLNSRQGVTLIDIQTNMVLRYIKFDNLKQVIRFELNLCQWILDNQKITHL